MNSLHQVIGFCLKEVSSPGTPFNGRIWTDEIVGQGQLGVLLHDGEGGGDMRSMGLSIIKDDPAKLKTAFIVSDANLTDNEGGDSRDAAVIDLFVRGWPTGHTLVQFYEHDVESGAGKPIGNLALMGVCEQLLV
ncbi:MAG: hypothetical protein AAF514_12495 [Verrucomicrobiota bacterium]